MAKPNRRNPMVKAIEAIAQRMTSGLPDHKSALQMQAEVNRLKLRAEALDNVNLTRSPLDTEAAHALKVAKLARSFDKEVIDTINRTSRIYAEAYKETQSRIDDKVNLRPDAFAPEIRAAFRTLSGAQKSDLITRLVKENRGPELAAIVKAPAVLTGLTDEARDAYERMMLSTHAAPDVDELAKLDDLLSSVSAASRAADSMVKELTDPRNLAEIESQAVTADEAIAAFSQTVQ
jgi:hypothetical protein